MISGSILAGDIVLIPDAPFTSHLGVKARPSLVVSGNKFNCNSPDVYLLPISSNIRYGNPNQFVIDTNAPYFVETGLKRASAIKCGAIFAYSKSQIRRQLGKIPPNILKQVRNIISDILTDD